MWIWLVAIQFIYNSIYQSNDYNWNKIFGSFYNPVIKMHWKSYISLKIMAKMIIVSRKKRNVFKVDNLSCFWNTRDGRGPNHMVHMDSIVGITSCLKVFYRYVRANTWITDYLLWVFQWYCGTSLIQIPLFQADCPDNCIMQISNVRIGSQACVRIGEYWIIQTSEVR